MIFLESSTSGRAASRLIIRWYLSRAAAQLHHRHVALNVVQSTRQCAHALGLGAMNSERAVAYTVPPGPSLTVACGPKGRQRACMRYALTWSFFALDAGAPHISQYGQPRFPPASSQQRCSSAWHQASSHAQAQHRRPTFIHSLRPSRLSTSAVHSTTAPASILAL